MRLLPCLAVIPLLAGPFTPVEAASSWKQAAERLHSKSKAERRQAVAELVAARDPEAVPALLEALKDSDAYNRIMAIRGLAYSRSDQAAKALIKALQDDKNAEVRETAALGLRVFNTPEAAAALRKAMKDGVDRIRIAAVASATAVRDTETFAALSEAASDTSPLVRQRVAIALGEINEPKAKTVLETLVNDSDTAVKAAAQQALKQYAKETK